MRDLAGRKFGWLRVIQFWGYRGGYYWLCRCQCGVEGLFLGSNLLRGRSKSCGCLRKQISSRRAKQLAAIGKNGAANLTHGLARDPLYRTWNAMVQRCTNSRQVGWKAYGGRGIRVCERWKGPGGLKHFIQDMGRPSAPGLSIERKNVNGDYEPGNCIWLPRSLQGRNTRRTLYVTFNGQRKTLLEWVDQLGLDYNLVQSRLARGQSPELAFSPLRQNSRYLTFGGETKTMGEWAATVGLSLKTLSARLSRGWSLERALT